MAPTTVNKKVSITCMPASLSILRTFLAFPSKNTELEPGIVFYLKFLGVSLLGSLPMLSSIMHLINTVQNGKFHHIDLDLTYAVSFSTAYALIWAFIIKIKSAAKMYTFISDFEVFGKPTDFDRCNKAFNRYAKIHFVYLELLIWTIILTSNIFKTQKCKLENQLYNMNEVCGLFSYTWMPFDIDYSPIRELYLLFEIFGAHHIYMLAGLMAWQVFETMQHIIIRIRHVKHVMVEAFTYRDSTVRRRKFNIAVRYHNSIFGLFSYCYRLEEKLNDAFSIFMFTHMVLTAAVLGIGIYSWLRVKSLSTFMVCTGWFVGLFMDCFSGQRLQDESLELAVAVYNLPWYDCEEPLKKDIMVVLQKCQSSLKLRAGAFGVMDRAMFLGVIKLTYSYITLLKQT
ncbi:odorant receptor 4-like [Diorhabda sublineata]|uniref:odorant receptor 4-like n=1 Tax=Diorhabda sublineata TaxID=1163346 RepID=UPI0024E182FA|nr:odorant receptor 4-like [Diorhabda sublineata]